jgi:hypothetical protein
MTDFPHSTLPLNDAPEAVVDGYNAFWEGHSLSIIAHQGPSKVAGWWRGWSQAYALGILASRLSFVDTNPFPQFSGPWEAWADGYNDEPGL